MLINHKALEEFVAMVCVNAGATETGASQVSRLLVEANLQGHDSHGVGMLPLYVRNIHKGFLQPREHARKIDEHGSYLQMDGRAGFGQIVGPEAINAGIDNARRNGVTVLTLKNAHHLGRIGGMGEQVAAAGLISMHYVNVVGHRPFVAPFGGASGRMNTNPFCCAIPVKGAAPIIFDMATSTIALGKARVAHNAGVEVPEGCLVDHQGLPTTDPAVMFSKPNGAMTYVGGHKGYGLALICEVLAGALAGNWTIQPENPRPLNVINNMLTVILDPERIGDRAAYEREARALIDYVKSTPPAAGVDEVLIPGEPEQVAKKERQQNGISLAEATWEELLVAAESVSIPRDQVRTLLEP